MIYKSIYIYYMYIYIYVYHIVYTYIHILILICIYIYISIECYIFDCTLLPRHKVHSLLASAREISLRPLHRSLVSHVKDL